MFTRSSIALAATIIAFSPAHADDTTSLSDVVVTATRDERPVEKAPFYAYSLQDDALYLDMAIRSVPEALKYQTGTLVQKTAQGQGSPYIRGFTGFRNLFLIDGIRLNNSVFRDGPNQYWNTVDAMALSRLEAVHGPFSVLYGSDAVGGTLNTITRGAADLREGSTWDSRVYYRYASAEEANVARIESIGFVTPGLAVTLGLSTKTFGDVRGGEEVGTQDKTGYDEFDWDAKLEWFLADNALLTLAHQSVDMDDAWRTHKTLYGSDWKGLSVGTELKRALDQDRRLTYLQYHRQDMSAFCSDLKVGLSHHLQEEERDRIRTGDRHDVQGFDVNTLGAFVQFKSPTAIGDLVYGTEYYHDAVTSFKDTLNPDGTVRASAIQGPVADDATYDTLGIYLQDSLPLGNTVSLVIGARYDYANADAGTVMDPVTGGVISISDGWSSVVGSGRLLWHLDPEERCHLFAGISQGFRAPNLSDLTRLDSARSNEIETPSPDLDPEHFLSYEVGLKAKASRLSGQFTYFYTDIDSMIVRTPTGLMIEEEFEVTKKNGGDGYVQGIELQSRCLLGAGLSAFGSFTWMDGEVETYPTSDPTLVTEPLDRLMPPTGRVGLRWTAEAGVWMEVAGTFAADADELSTRDTSDTSRIPPGGTPGYSVVEVRAGWNVSPDIRLSAAIENLTDEDYRVHGSGLNEPGRNLILAGEWMF